MEDEYKFQTNSVNKSTTSPFKSQSRRYKSKRRRKTCYVYSDKSENNESGSIESFDIATEEEGPKEESILDISEISNLRISSPVEQTFNAEEMPDTISSPDTNNEILICPLKSNSDNNDRVIETDASCLNISETPALSNEENTEEMKGEEQHEDKAIIEDINTEYISFLPKNAKTYETDKFSNNVMYIFNQIHVDGYAPRVGTEKDVEALKACFGSIGFEVESYDDFTKKEIFDKLEDISTSDFSDCGSLAIVMLTHGSSRGMLKAKDRSFHESELLDTFKTHDKPSLVTKPKLFLVQACRGYEVSRAAGVGFHAPVRLDAEGDRDTYTLPAEADFLLVHSTYAGRAAHRETTGSWFIQTLCQKIAEATECQDLMSIMTDVLRAVAVDKQNQVYNPSTGKIDTNKQMPVVISTLTRLWFLKNNESKADSGNTNYGDNLYARQEDRYSNSATLEIPVMDRSKSFSSIDPNYTPFFDSKMQDLLWQYFLYIRDILDFFLREYEPMDNLSRRTGQMLYNIAFSINTEDTTRCPTRDSVAKEMSSFLEEHARKWCHYRQIFFYDSGI